MAREMRFLDIPDGYPLPRDWILGLGSRGFMEQVRLIEEIGPVFAGCQKLADNKWLLHEPIGFGDIANLVFISLRDGNLFALHGFTSRSSEEFDRGIALAESRRLDLI